MAMDHEYAKLFDSLRAEAIDLHLRWKLYRHLYAGPKEDIVALSSTAPSIFAILQSLLFEDCVLRICRITDPNSRGSYEYISVFQLAESLRKAAVPNLDLDLQPVLRDLEAACSKMRTLRNVRIAHSDLKQALQIAADPMPGVSVEDVNSALGLFSKLLNSVEIPLRRTCTFHGDVLLPIDGDANRLLALLRQENARLLNGRGDS
jgi:AbiU2